MNYENVSKAGSAVAFLLAEEAPLSSVFLFLESLGIFFILLQLGNVSLISGMLTTSCRGRGQWEGSVGGVSGRGQWEWVSGSGYKGMKGQKVCVCDVCLTQSALVMTM